MSTAVSMEYLACENTLVVLPCHWSHYQIPPFAERTPERGCPTFHSFLLMASALPVLLPPSALPRAPSSHEWSPKGYLEGPQPPPVDDARMMEQEMAVARQLADGKAVKKTRPRRTVDYNGGMGRWNLVSTIESNLLFISKYILASETPFQSDLCTLYKTCTSLHNRCRYCS